MTKARDLADGANAFDVVSVTELEYLNGVSSAIQTQIDGKQAVVSGVDSTEIGYLDGVSSAIQTQIDGKTAKSTLTTTGDIYYASSASTPARLGIGSAGQVLTVASGIPSWAAASSGGITLLSTTTLSGASTTISISATTYTNLLIYIYGVIPSASGSDIRLQPNSQTANTNWTKLHLYATSCDVEFGSNTYYRTFSPKTSAGENAWVYQIYNINSSQYKSFTVTGGANSDDSNRQASEDGGGIIKDTNAITSLKIEAAAGTYSAGTVLIYGVK